MSRKFANNSRASTCPKPYMTVHPDTDYKQLKLYLLKLYCATSCHSLYVYVYICVVEHYSIKAVNHIYSLSTTCPSSYKNENINSLFGMI